jgi:hypothetical protein
VAQAVLRTSKLFPSTGIMSVLVAMSLCRKVSLYGFGLRNDTKCGKYYGRCVPPSMYFSHLSRKQIVMESKKQKHIMEVGGAYHDLESETSWLQSLGYRAPMAEHVKLAGFDAVSLRMLDASDVVSVTLVHLLSSGYGETSTPLPLRRWLGPAGLSARGRALIEQLDADRVLLDLAHASIDTFWDAVSVHDRTLPLAITHTGVSGVHPHWRNVDDAQLKAVANTDGIVGVIFQPSFLGPKDSHDDGVALVMRHLAHIVAVVGEDHAALGSDWDGFIVPSPDLRDPLALPGLVVEMQARGWREERIKKILGGNFRRVLGALRPG